MSKMPDSRTISALLEEQAARFGDREAVVAGVDRLTYRDFFSAVRRVARGLHAMGIGRGDHVAILMGNRIEWMLSFFALQRLGATAVGLNTWSTPRELEYALSHADVKCLIAVDRFRRNDYRAMLAGMQPKQERLPRLECVVWLSEDGQPLAVGPGEATWEGLLEKSGAVDDDVVDQLARQVSPDDVAMLLYTSGSTAAPKGILLQHANWIRNSFDIGERQKVTEVDRLWLAVSLFWSFGSVNAMPNMFSHGACTVLQEHFDAAEALKLIELEKCSIMYGTPNMVRALVEHPDRGRHDLSSLRSGAMIGSPEQIADAIALGATQICNVYGLSETYGNCNVIDADEPAEIRLESVGVVLPGFEQRICDMETGEPMPAEHVGEIRVKGPLFAGYFKDEEKTREAFDEDGFFRTGDIGMLDRQGRLFYRGRLKEMVKSGGINIAPIEVEETLMRHPAVRLAYVIGMPDPQLDEVLVAIVVLNDDATTTPEELKAFCKQELAAYKIPTKFRFTIDSELPLTSTGKLQKMKLRDLIEQETERA
jgi:fatty-acyl-CoA synthase